MNRVNSRLNVSAAVAGMALIGMLASCQPKATADGMTPNGETVEVDSGIMYFSHEEIVQDSGVTTAPVQNGMQPNTGVSSLDEDPSQYMVSPQMQQMLQPQQPQQNP